MAFFTNEDAAIAFLDENQVFDFNKGECEVCGQGLMKPFNCPDRKGMLRCDLRICRHTKSMFNGTFFNSSRVPINVYEIDEHNQKRIRMIRERGGDEWERQNE